MSTFRPWIASASGLTSPQMTKPSHAYMRWPLALRQVLLRLGANDFAATVLRGWAHSLRVTSLRSFMWSGMAAYTASSWTPWCIRPINGRVSELRSLPRLQHRPALQVVNGCTWITSRTWGSSTGTVAGSKGPPQDSYDWRDDLRSIAAHQQIRSCARAPTGGGMGHLSVRGSRHVRRLDGR